MIRREYSGVAPWEWEAHPIWLQRVQITLLAEIEGAQIREQAEND